MSNSGTLLGILFLFIFMVPILYLVFRERNKTRAVKNYIQQTATKFNLSGIEPVEIGHLIFLVNTNEKRGIIFNSNATTNQVAQFDKNTHAIIARFEDEKLANGKSIISKIIVTVKNPNTSEHLNVFDETYPNQLQCNNIVDQTKNMVHRLQRL
ncbi:hypothetical protein [Neptunitalea lumnitzerae]|uniref:Uncharacterized protein n=1 Tax=Neptunitalea lumnitzerae TaxID=2965509 RepID=A0ABQ5MFQ5_9FLAO|nr:hypothetical protein [Neptunitalea sp. Y10]GLB48224.1 hypothetical protein Y10_05920 [Neptunitalea sp. Y10]